MTDEFEFILNPSEYIASPTYWQQHRVIDNPRQFGSGLFDANLNPILHTYHKTKNAIVEPTRIEDGQILPRIHKHDGMLRLVIDEFNRTELRGRANILNIPTGGEGTSVNKDMFDKIAAEMMTSHWYDKESIKYTNKYKDGDWTVSEEIKRRVSYVVATPKNDGWFQGFKAKTMDRQPKSWTLPLITLRMLDEEFYSRRVGDVIAQVPNVKGKTGRIERMTVHEKISAAFLYLA